MFCRYYICGSKTTKYNENKNKYIFKISYFCLYILARNAKDITSLLLLIVSIYDFNHFTWISCCYAISGYVMCYYATSTNNGTCSNMNAFQNRTICSNKNVIINYNSFIYAVCCILSGIAPV